MQIILLGLTSTGRKRKSSAELWLARLGDAHIAVGHARTSQADRNKIEA
jgi:hypothetical protein